MPEVLAAGVFPCRLRAESHATVVLSIGKQEIEGTFSKFELGHLLEFNAFAFPNEAEILSQHMTRKRVKSMIVRLNA